MSQRRLFLLLIAITLAACKAPEEPAPAAVVTQPQGRPDAHQCAFVSDQEASQVMGMPYLAQRAEPSESGCYFQPAQGQAQNIYLEIIQNTNGFYEVTTQPDAEIVGDLGDRAVWLSSARILHVVDGDRTIRVKMGTEKTRPSEVLAKAKGLARLVVGRR